MCIGGAYLGVEGEVCDNEALESQLLGRALLPPAVRHEKARKSIPRAGFVSISGSVLVPGCACLLLGPEGLLLVDVGLLGARQPQLLTFLRAREVRPGYHRRDIEVEALLCQVSHDFVIGDSERRELERLRELDFHIISGYDIFPSHCAA